MLPLCHPRAAITATPPTVRMGAHPRMHASARTRALARNWMHTLIGKGEHALLDLLPAAQVPGTHCAVLGRRQQQVWGVRADEQASHRTLVAHTLARRLQHRPPGAEQHAGAIGQRCCDGVPAGRARQLQHIGGAAAAGRVRRQGGAVWAEYLSGGVIVQVLASSEEASGQSGFGVGWIKQRDCPSTPLLPDRSLPGSHRQT